MRRGTSATPAQFRLSPTTPSLPIWQPPTPPARARRLAPSRTSSARRSTTASSSLTPTASRATASSRPPSVTREARRRSGARSPPGMSTRTQPCLTQMSAQFGAVGPGSTAQDLSSAINVPGLSNLSLTIVGASLAGVIVTGTGTYNGAGWAGTVVLFRHGGELEIFAVGATVFNVSVPAQQVVQQIGSAIGQDPSNINPGFVVDRLFTCEGVAMIDGRVGA